MTPPGEKREFGGPVAVLAFVCELGMLALLAVAGASFGSGAVSVVLAIALPLAAAAIWAVWMAPKSPRRLPDPVRVLAQILLFDAVGAIVWIAGQPLWGIGFAVVASTVFALARRAE